MVTRVGVLALQGDVAEHVAALAACGAEPVEVKYAHQLDTLDGIVIPGGESTTIARLAQLYGLFDPLAKHLASGMPALGTCAGMILMASGTEVGSQPQLGVLDVVVRRNAWGSQNESFEADLEVRGLDDPVKAVFIRAPWVASHGPSVEVLAHWGDHPVLVRQAGLFGTSFHPELTSDRRIHAMFLSAMRGV